MLTCELERHLCLGGITFLCQSHLSAVTVTITNTLYPYCFNLLPMAASDYVNILIIFSTCVFFIHSDGQTHRFIQNCGMKVFYAWITFKQRILIFRVSKKFFYFKFSISFPAPMPEHCMWQTVTWTILMWRQWHLLFYLHTYMIKMNF